MNCKVQVVYCPRFIVGSRNQHHQRDHGETSQAAFEDDPPCLTFDLRIHAFVFDLFYFVRGEAYTTPGKRHSGFVAPLEKGRGSSRKEKI